MSKNFRWVLLFSGILSISAGLYMFANPAISLASITLFLGFVLLFNGVAEIFQFFSKKNGIILFNGIMTVILSLCLLSSTWIGLVSFIPFMFAFWVLLSGFAKLFLGFSVRKFDKKESNYWILVGVLGIITGLFLCGHPLFTGLMLAYMIGFGFIYQGCASFATFYQLGKK